MPKKKKTTKRKAAAASPPAGGKKKAKGESGSGSSWLLVDKGEIGARYADPEADSPGVGIDGIIQLAEDLQIEVEDPVFLVLAWEMQAETQGVFKRSEVSVIPHSRAVCRCSLPPATADSRAVPTCLVRQWLGGFERIFQGTKDFMLRVDDLKKKLPKLRAKLSRMDDLESIWNWCFDFCKVRDLATDRVAAQT